jgi:ATP-dependent DNA ligase
VAGAAAQLPVGTVLDGELVVWDTAGERLDVAAVQHRAMSARGAAVLARQHPASHLGV